MIVTKPWSLKLPFQKLYTDEHVSIYLAVYIITAVFCFRDKKMESGNTILLAHPHLNSKRESCDCNPKQAESNSWVC